MQTGPIKAAVLAVPARTTESAALQAKIHSLQRGECFEVWDVDRKFVDNAVQLSKRRWHYDLSIRRIDLNRFLVIRNHDGLTEID